MILAFETVDSRLPTPAWMGITNPLRARTELKRTRARSRGKRNSFLLFPVLLLELEYLASSSPDLKLGFTSLALLVFRSS